MEYLRQNTDIPKVMNYIERWLGEELDLAFNINIQLTDHRKTTNSLTLSQREEMSSENRKYNEQSTSCNIIYSIRLMKDKQVALVCTYVALY